jgi:hypothetical protein
VTIPNPYQEEQVQGESAPRSRSLSGEEVAEVRAWLQMKEDLKHRTAREQAEREAMMNQPRFLAASETGLGPGPGPVQVARALPHLPSGWANGFKTSEFWTAVAGVLLAVAKGYGYAIPEDAFWGIVVYILGRSGMKSAAAFRSGLKQ